jgi:hypothetical protein
MKEASKFSDLDYLVIATHVRSNLGTDSPDLHDIAVYPLCSPNTV